MSTPLSSWLAGADVTTPAHDRLATTTAPLDPPRRGGRTGPLDALVFLAAVWLVLASVPMVYQPTGRFDLLWNDVVVGTAVGVVTMVRLVRPGVAAPTAGITCALGGWLVLAPLVFGYGAGRAGHAARWNDLTVGAVVVVLSLATTVAARMRPADPVLRGSPGLVVGAVEPAD
jgi:hypothetical protein